MPVHDCRATLTPVAPFGETGTPVPMLLMNLMTLLQMGPEVVGRAIVAVSETITLAAVPVKLVRRGFVPFLEVAAAILMALADALALGP